MNIEFHSKKDRAVSPVIGVILMVAITVILAAVIGAFVLGLGDDLGNSSGPSASLSLSDGTLSHNGGDTLTDAELRGAVSDPGNIPAEFAAGDTTDISGSLDGPGTVTVVVGDTVVASFEIEESGGQAQLSPAQIAVDPISGSTAAGQQIQYTATVTDSNGDPVEGISVEADGSAGQDIVINGGTTTATDSTASDGTVTFTVESSTQQTESNIVFTENTNDNSVTATVTVS